MWTIAKVNGFSTGNWKYQMNKQPLDNNPIETPPPQSEGTPPSALKPAAWTANDSWLGLGILILLVAAYFLVVYRFEESQNLGILVVATFEFILLIPIALIFFLRKVSWIELGLRGFERNALALGCGLLAAVYFIVIINNLVMMALGVVTQADVITEVLGEIDSPFLLAFVTAIVAPITEELFFRGFLFKGLRQKYGWINALMFSSIIFALFHGQLATLIPTFLLGALFAYMYQRTESVLPGMILHFVVNSMGICVLLAASHYGFI
ncbi:MAG: CPBP family intramembrane metalloprotease [Chloroflexi bacterium CFX2]|nr:CPBP family intramembrane metalloprotease [Chloroflexi bacterium CFX2]